MRRIGFLLWFGCCGMAAGAEAPEALSLAMRLAPFADIEQDTGARVREALADALGRAGCFDAARDVSMGITNYRRGLALGRAALYACEAGNLRAAGSLLAGIHAAALSEGEWRRSRIEAYRAAILAGLGRFDEANAVLDGSLDPEDLVLARTLVALALSRAGRIAEAEPMIQSAEGGRMVAAAAWQADAHLAMAGVIAGTGADGAAQELRQSAAELAIKSPHWIHPWELDRAGQILRGAMPLDAATVRAWIEGAEVTAKAIYPVLEERPRELTRAALCWAAIGQADRSAETIRLAREATRAIPPNERPTALAGLAIALERIGGNEEAEATWDEATRAAAGHHNARIRARELVHVLIAHQAMGRSLPDAMRKTAVQALEALEGRVRPANSP